MKIVAIVLIVISHVVQTLTSENPYMSYQGYVLDIACATKSIQCFTLVCFRAFGALGNSLFFVCSAWFLLESASYRKEKIFSMLCEIWSVSIIVLLITYRLIPQKMSTTIFIRSLFPTTFSNNWYMTCYMIFYAIHPVLNKIIQEMNQIQLFRCSIILATMYLVIGSIKQDLFFSSSLILWGTIYFMIAYMKKYMRNFADNNEVNIILCCMCVLGFVGLNLMTDIGGGYLEFLSDKMLHWSSNCNPFIIGIAITMFNLARNLSFQNKKVNYISSLSLLIYVIHENLILRTYFRPLIWIYIFQNWGYQHVLTWVLVVSCLVFIFGLLCAFTYSFTIKKGMFKPIHCMYDWMRKKYLVEEKKYIR